MNDLLKAFEVPVIFITAYPERFLTGERPEPAFLIAKPFQPANVSAVISQALFFQQSARRREVARHGLSLTVCELQVKARPAAGLFFVRVMGAKKDGLMNARLKVPANAQGECGEDQEAGCPVNAALRRKVPPFRFRQTMTASGELGFAERTFLRFVVRSTCPRLRSPS